MAARANISLKDGRATTFAGGEIGGCGINPVIETWGADASSRDLEAAPKPGGEGIGELAGRGSGYIGPKEEEEEEEEEGGGGGEERRGVAETVKRRISQKKKKKKQRTRSKTYPNAQ